MFEFSILLKYIIPKKKQFSVTLIACMSVTVITLVVWLLLVFLSVTQGMEKAWLDKLTCLNAPIRINPTEKYYKSYYYLVDSISEASEYSSKNIFEKQMAEYSDPYAEGSDTALPASWPKADLDKGGKLKDPVKGAFAVLRKLKTRHPSLAFQDYEISPALLKLRIIQNQDSFSTTDNLPSATYLTQVSYVSSISETSPYLRSLVLPPTVKDISHLLKLCKYDHDSQTIDKAPYLKYAPKELFQEQISSILQNICIKKIRTDPLNWQLPSQILPQNIPFYSYINNDPLFEKKVILIEEKSSKKSLENLSGGFFSMHRTQLYFQGKLIPSYPIYLNQSIIFDSQLDKASLDTAAAFQNINFHVKGSIQNREIQGMIPWKDIFLENIEIQERVNDTSKAPPPWPHIKDGRWQLPTLTTNEKGILLAKTFQDSGAMVGDRGYLSYQALSNGSPLEERIPIFVAGFYDPGIISTGNRYILVPRSITQLINSSASSQLIDKTESNGIQVWVENLSLVDLVKKEIEEAFARESIDTYWSVKSYKEYDFAKDLLAQFQSDRYLFTLIAVIILIVACSNIFSLLVILVNDKKKEIAILQAMGAPLKSIALIFGGCGAFVGLSSSLIGTAAAHYTLKNLKPLLSLINQMQGHTSHPLLYETFPHQLSTSAALFILIATPCISILAGLIPALLACKLSPSAILRSE